MDISSANRFKIYILIVVLLIGFSSAQRGGSSSKSSSSSSSRSSGYRSSNYYGSNHHHANQNCTTINGTRTCTYVDQPLSWTAILIILGVIVAVVGGGAYFGDKQQQVRKSKLEGIFKDFQVKSQEYPSSLQEQQRAMMLDAFMKISYTIVVRVKNNSEKFFCQIKVTDLKKQNQNKYRIRLSGSDQLGTSKFDGLLIFKADGMGIKLSKEYDDKTKAGQTGNWDTLIYQGFGNPDKIDGQWAFLGYQTSLQYSGSWSMLQL